jgi:hypothetical protein
MGLRKVTDRRDAPYLVGISTLLAIAGCGSSGASNHNSTGTSMDGGGGTGSAGGGGTGGGGGGSVMLSDCVSADTKPCSTFAYPLEDGGTQPVQLGPYGAQMDVNVGVGFENTVAAGDMSPGTCQVFAASFGEPPEITNMLLKTSMNGITINFSLYTVYRPANWPTTGPVPVITWGNGTCAQPEGYGALLRYVASHGYFVVAANSRFVAGGAPMLKALDFAGAANMDPSSPYYQKLDMTKVGAMGHSQGSGATASAASDSRILDVILFNGGTNAAKPYVAVSGDMDIGGQTPSTMASAINAAPKAAWVYYHHPAGVGGLRGHLVLMLTPERVEEWTVAWWDMVLKSDASARDWFVGGNCKLCNQTADFEYGEHGLD